MFTYRVWPNGTIQEIDEEPYHWMGDDYTLICAEDYDDALSVAEKEGLI